MCLQRAAPGCCEVAAAMRKALVGHITALIMTAGGRHAPQDGTLHKCTARVSELTLPVSLQCLRPSHRCLWWLLVGFLACVDQP
jgi:hypothetical protein